MVDSIKAAEGKANKVAILSLFAPYFPGATTQQLFGVDGNEVHRAKIHDADVGGGVHAEEVMQQRF